MFLKYKIGSGSAEYTGTALMYFLFFIFIIVPCFKFTGQGIGGVVFSLCQ